MTSLTKYSKQNKNCFQLQTQRLAKSFEGLDSYLRQSTGKLWSCTVVQK